MNKNYFVILIVYFEEQDLTTSLIYGNVIQECKNRDNEQFRHTRARASRQERIKRYCGKLSPLSRRARDAIKDDVFPPSCPLACIKISRFPRIIVNPGVSPEHIALKNRRHSSWHRGTPPKLERARIRSRLSSHSSLSSTVRGFGTPLRRCKTNEKWSH